MRPRVIVLGAGASSSYEDSPTGVRPPLAKEIFSAFHSLSISRNRFVLIGYIINYTRDTRGIDSIDFGAWDEDVELLLTEIDEKVQLLAQQQKTGKGNAETFSDLVKVQGAYNQLIFMFTSIFNEIQNGPVSIPYAILASELTSEDTLITFNWDALMDRALLSTNRWFPNDGYCIKPEYIFNDGWWEPPKFDYLKGGPKYIKLHGSTNWLMPYHGINLTTGELFTFNAYAMDKLYVFLKATHPYETYLNRYWGPYETFSYCYYPPNLPLSVDTVKDGKKWIMGVSAIDLPEHGTIMPDVKKVFSMPLIVPPVRNKQYARYGKIFSELWNLAEKSICECKKIFIIGYSFPDTDTVSRDMFRRAIYKNKEIEKFVIINPNSDRIVSILTKDFGVDASKIITKAAGFDIRLLENSKILDI